MKTGFSQRAQRIRADRAIERVREVAAAHVQPAELEALTSGAAADAGRLAIGAEALVLISTGIGLVSSGLGILIKNHNLDIRLAVTLWTGPVCAYSPSPRPCSLLFCWPQNQGLSGAGWQGKLEVWFLLRAPVACWLVTRFCRFSWD